MASCVSLSFYEKIARLSTKKIGLDRCRSAQVLSITNIMENEYTHVKNQLMYEPSKVFLPRVLSFYTAHNWLSVVSTKWICEPDHCFTSWNMDVITAELQRTERAALFLPCLHMRWRIAFFPWVLLGPLLISSVIYYERSGSLRCCSSLPKRPV